MTTTTTALQALIDAALNQPGDTAIFAIWEAAADYSTAFEEQVRLRSAREVVSSVLKGMRDWLDTPQARAALAAPAPALDAPAEQPVTWRCFHCDEQFMDADAARLHFGASEYDKPACQVDVVQLRWLEAQHRRTCEEDTDLHRTILGMACEHERLRKRAEEDGYAKGLADAARASQPTPAQDAAATVPASEWEKAGWRTAPAVLHRLRLAAKGVSGPEMTTDLTSCWVKVVRSDLCELLRHATPPAPHVAPTAAQPRSVNVRVNVTPRAAAEMTSQLADLWAKGELPLPEGVTIGFIGTAQEPKLTPVGCGDGNTYVVSEQPVIKTRAAPTTPQAPALVPLTEHHKLDNDRQVFFYEQDFYVLSNFSSFSLRWKGLDFPTSEHAYHWEKFNMRGEQQAECRNRIHGARSAHDAFQLAAELKPFRRAAWDELKVGIMRDILRAKAQQHEYVHRKLLATGDRELIEDSWRDDYWGWGPNRDGQNMLGNLWMEVRAELRDGITPTTKEQQS